MKKIWKLIGVLMLCIWGYIPLVAQSLLPDVRASGGEVFETPNLRWEWNIGESIVGPVNNGQVQLEQGFFASTCPIGGNGMVQGDCYFVAANDSVSVYRFIVSGIVNATDYLWTIVPSHAVTIVQGQGTDTIDIKFTDSLTTSMYLTVTPYNACDTGNTVYSDLITIDTAAVFPGDINNDGIVTNTRNVSWVTDALSLDKAWVEYFYGVGAGYLDTTSSYNYQMHIRDLPCSNTGLVNKFDWGPHPMKDWLKANGQPFNYNDVDGSIRNLRYADADGNGRIERGVSDHYKMTGNLNSNDITDTDVIFYNLDKEHDGNVPKSIHKNAGADLQIVHYKDSIDPVSGDNLVLSIFAGDINNTIDMRAIALKVHFEIGLYKRPYIEYVNSHFGNSLVTHHADYIHIDQDTSNTYAYITISRDDLVNASFSYNRICNLICDVPVAGYGGNAKNGFSPLTKNSQGVDISIVEAGALDSLGNFIPLSVSSITAELGTPSKKLRLKAALEGPFNTGTGLMEDHLNTLNLLPVTTPYIDSTVYPQIHEVIDTLQPSVQNNTTRKLIDWGRVELRSKGDSTHIIATQSVLIWNDGTITDIAGHLDISISGVTEDSAYVVFMHRNHLAVMSNQPIVLGDTATLVDFTDPNTPVFGGSLARKNQGGIMLLFSADGDADQQITVFDKNNAWLSQSGTSGYQSADWNLDGNVTVSEKNTLWLNNSGKGSQVPPASN